jgi:hypothetical protein
VSKTIRPAPVHRLAPVPRERQFRRPLRVSDCQFALDSKGRI